MQKKSFFITLEGVEGAGKSSAIRVIEAFLKQNNIDYITTREPGGTPIAEEIRNVLLTHHTEKMAGSTEVLLAFAGRAQHLERVIKPALQAGKWVICDRFTDASYAYQGAGRNIPEERIEILENWVQDTLRPDLTILMDLDPEIGLDRARKCSELDRIEVENKNFFQRVRNCYLERAQKYESRYVIIDAERSIDYVSNAIKATLEKMI